jgi:hypothetical protein
MSKGRSKKLMQLRIEYLVKRYYYWYEIERLRIDDVLNTLENKEVFLDSTYMLRLINQNNHLLKQLKQNRVSARKLDQFQFNTGEFVQGELFAEVA